MAKLDNLKELLFSENGNVAYAVLDGASIEGLLEQMFQLEPECECLYRGDLEPDIAEVAPYLIRLEYDHPFTQWLLPRAVGEPWGVFALADRTLVEMRKHFRRFLIVRDPEGKPLYFRYYDPRVLETYLPTCNLEELTTVFGPVEQYIACHNRDKILSFALSNGRLQSNEMKTE